MMSKSKSIAAALIAAEILAAPGLPCYQALAAAARARSTAVRPRDFRLGKAAPARTLSRRGSLKPKAFNGGALRSKPPRQIQALPGDVPSATALADSTNLAGRMSLFAPKFDKLTQDVSRTPSSLAKKSVDDLTDQVFEFSAKPSAASALDGVKAARRGGLKGGGRTAPPRKGPAQKEPPGGDKKPPSPPSGAGSPQSSGPGDSAAKLPKSLDYLLNGLVLTSIGSQFTSVTMPLLMHEVFGGFAFLATLGIAAEMGSLAGQLLGTEIIKSLGEQKSWLVYKFTYYFKWAAVSGMAASLLLAATSPLLWLGIYGINGFLNGVHSSAGDLIVVEFLEKENKKSQAMLDTWSSKAQKKLEMVSIPGPPLIGLLVKKIGLKIPQLFYPVFMAAAILMFFNRIDLSAGARSRLGSTMRMKLRAAWEKVKALYRNRRVVFQRLLGHLQKAREKVKTEYAPSLNKALRSPWTWTALLGYHAFWAFRSLGASFAMSAAQAAWWHVAVPFLILGLGAHLHKMSGRRVVLSNPRLRTMFLSQTGLILLNSLLYGVVAPAYATFLVAGQAQNAAMISGWMVALYSLGGLWAAIEIGKGAKKDMWITAAAEEKIRSMRLSEGAKWLKLARLKQANAIRAMRVTARWMKWAAAGLVLFGLMHYTSPLFSAAVTVTLPPFNPVNWLFDVYAVYPAMVIFGLTNVYPAMKVSSLLRNETPSKSRGEVFGFMKFVETIIVMACLYGASQMFDYFSTAAGGSLAPREIAFVVFNAAMALLAGGYLWLSGQIKKYAYRFDKNPV